MLSALSNQGIGLPVRNRKVFTSDVVIRAKANANKVTLKHDGTDANVVPSVGSFNIDVTTGSSLKVRRSDITARVVTINPDSAGAGIQINSWGKLELEASNGSSPLYLRGSRFVFNNLANTAPVSLIGTTDLLTVYDGAGSAIKDLKARTLFGVAQAATDIPLSITLAAAQSANAFNITSNGGTAGDILSVTSAGILTAVQVNATGDIRAGATGSIYWNTRSAMSSPSNGLVRVGSLDGTNYITIGHDGTNGSISTSSGSLNVGTNNRNTVLGGLWTIYSSNGAFQTAGQYPIVWSGQSVGLYPNSSGVLEVNSGTSGAFRDLYTRSQRIYNSTFANYLALSHNGTNPIISSSSGTILPQTPSGTQTMLVQAASGQSASVTIFSVLDSASDPLLVVNGTGVSRNAAASGGWDIRSNVGFSTRNSSNHFNLGNVSGVRWCGSSGDATAGSVTEAIYRRSGGGGVEINNGTIGTLRDLYARTVYGIAQAATDIPLVIQGAASQSANLTQWKNSSGTVIASVDYGGSITAGQNIVVGNGFWLAWPNSVAMTATGDGVLLLSSFGSSTANRIQFNGQTSSYPAIKRNGAGLDIRLADDSGYATLNAGNVTSNGNPVGTGKDIYNMIW